MDDKNIKFVTRHYRRDAFSASKAWRRIGIGIPSSRSLLKIAASVAIFLAVTATATVIIRERYFAPESPSPEILVPAEQQNTRIIKVIDFENATLPEVLSSIKDVYDVDVTNIPENADSYRLTLHYEGNASDLVNTINEILDLNLIIKE